MSQAEFSHETRFMAVTDNFNQLSYDFLATKLS